MQYLILKFSVLLLLLITQIQSAEEAPYIERLGAGAKMKALFGMGSRSAHHRAQSVQVRADHAFSSAQKAHHEDVQKFAEAVVVWQSANTRAVAQADAKAVLSSLSLDLLKSLLSKSHRVFIRGVMYEVQVQINRPFQNLIKIQELIKDFDDVARNLDILPTKNWIDFASPYCQSEPCFDANGKMIISASQELSLSLAHPKTGAPIPINIKIDEVMN